MKTDIKSFEQFINEELDGSTTTSPGSGTAVGGGASGSFTSSAGVSVYGGDSGSAFATNSNTSGMGNVISPQPSSIPGNVAGSSKGSGDISKGYIGPYTKLPTSLKNKKGKKRKTNYAQKGANIDKFYTSKYMEKQSNGKLITKWNVFKEKYEN